MQKRVAAMFLVLGSVAILASCVNTSTRFLYAAIPNENEIFAYREDPNSGVLTQLTISPITAGAGVRALAIDPSNKYMYAANNFEDDVSLYTLSPSGAITEVTPRTQTGTGPSLLVVDSAGQYLYVANTAANSISSFSIGSGGVLNAVCANPNPTCPTPSQFPIGAQPLNLQVAPSGNFLYITVGESQSGTTGSIEVWPLTAGVLGPQGVQIVPTGTTPQGLAIHPNGNFLYTANFGDNSISEFAIASDGSLTQLGTVAAGLSILSSPVQLLINKAGTYLYVVNETSSTIVAYSIASNGSLALLPTSYSVATNASPSFIASDASGDYLFVGNNASPSIQVFSVSSSTGVLTEVTSFSLGGNATTSLALTP
jgi:6-phosphogluconolactonase